MEPRQPTALDDFLFDLQALFPWTRSEKRAVSLGSESNKAMSPLPSLVSRER